MHYANGREAKNGDILIQVDSRSMVVGVLYNAVPGNNYCNGALAPLAGGTHIMACLADCLHIDDLYSLFGISNSSYTEYIREQLSKVPIKNSGV